MTTGRVEERLRALPPDWMLVPLGDLPLQSPVGYGITRPGPHVDHGVGMLRATDIQGGRVRPDQARHVSDQVDRANERSRIGVGDVLVVMVGRVGEAAVVTEEFAGWNISRTIGRVSLREEGPVDPAWLSAWLNSSYVRTWCAQRATGSTLQRTLNLAALRELPVPVPPRAQALEFLRLMTVIEEKAQVDAEIVGTAPAVADAWFRTEAAEGLRRAPFGELARISVGVRMRPHPEGLEPAGPSVPVVAPADILQSELAHLGDTGTGQVVTEDVPLCPPGSLLVAVREGGVRVVVNDVAVVPGRGVLVLEPWSEDDRYWLLHAIRCHALELASTAQGSAGREISHRAFAGAAVPWAPAEVRARFAAVAGRLHGRARTAAQEVSTLAALREVLLEEFLATGAAPSRGGPARGGGVQEGLFAME
ncbi:hypothetical protein ACIPYQ_16310 [Streptomyces sp. NPDC090045]|uniref:hypothetical protein n=1 Tax=Streptomyces sp. NPDC090045 TaxID=3365927 RepID=UPI003824C12F